MKRFRKFIKNVVAYLGKYKVRFVVASLILLAAIFFIRNANKPPEVEKTTVKRGNIVSVIEASGKVVADEYVNLGFAVPGKVVWVGVKKGDWVNQYQILATMDQREVQKTIKRSLLDYMNTRWSFEQLRDDYDVNGRPLVDVPGIDDTAKRLLEQSQFGLDQAVLDYEIANLAAEEYYIMAPFAGVVVSNGNLVAGERLSVASTTPKEIRIINPNTLYFQANVDEIDYAGITLGQKVEIMLDSFPDNPFTGTVTYIGKEGIVKTGGSVQIPVDIRFDAPLDQFVPELNGDVEIVMTERDNVLVLDKKFVSRTGNSYTVNILRDNKITSKTVEVGMVGKTKYEIVDGLKAGDEVVIEI